MSPPYRQQGLPCNQPWWTIGSLLVASNKSGWWPSHKERTHTWLLTVVIRGHQPSQCWKCFVGMFYQLQWLCFLPWDIGTWLWIYLYVEENSVPARRMPSVFSQDYPVIGISESKKEQDWVAYIALNSWASHFSCEQKQQSPVVPGQLKGPDVLLAQKELRQVWTAPCCRYWEGS